MNIIRIILISFVAAYGMEKEEEKLVLYVKRSCDMFWAAQQGLYTVVSAYITPENVNNENELGRTLLHEAARFGHNEIIRLLIGHGVFILKQDKFGCTALHYAALNGHVQCARILISFRRYLLKMKDGKGRIPLLCAVHKGCSDLFGLLNVRDAATIHSIKDIVFKEGSLELIESFIYSKVNIFNLIQINVLACLEKDNPVNSIKSLIEYSHSSDYKTVLHTVNSFINIIVELIDRGIQMGMREQLHLLVKQEIIDLNMKDGKNENLLYKAIRLRLKNVVEFLVWHGIDCCLANNKKQTPLHISVKKGDDTILAVLLRAKKNAINAADYCGRTAFHMAVSRENVSCIKMLFIFPGVDLSLKDSQNCTALQHAAQDGLLVSLYLLLELFEGLSSLDIKERHIVTALLKSSSNYGIALSQ